MPTIEEAYEHCRRIAKDRARHFFYSFRLLPPLQRESMCAIYAFTRRCDDIVDEDDVPLESRQAAIREWRTNLQRHFAGSNEDKVLAAFCNAFERHSIPRAYPFDLLDGMEGDLIAEEFQTFEDLYRYCYRAASVVGMATIHVFGFESREALALAERCGVAFQLTNIMRDIAADAAMGRVYLPSAELAEYGLSKDELLSGTVQAGEHRFQRFMDFQYQRAERYYSESAALLSMASPSCRAALWAMVATYHGILKRIREAGYDVLGAEVGLSKRGKAAIASHALWLRATGEGAIVPRVKIVGGALAGLAAAVRLGEAGLAVDVHEARTFLGGRAASYRLTPSDPNSERIDNCQHVLLRCCTELMDFYRRCGVADRIVFQSTLHLVRRGGVHDAIFRDPLPAPLHLARSLLQMRGLGWKDKLSLLLCLRAVPRARKRDDLDRITFADWLRQHGATARSIANFWRPVIVSALNEEPERASALPALHVFGEGLLGSRTSYEMGVPAVPLDELYAPALAGHLGPSVRLHLGSKVTAIDPLAEEADFYISAVPFDRVAALIPELGLDGQLRRYQSSPIVGVHLWFDRQVTELRHAMLVDGEIQWIFHKGGGYYLGVVSAARSLVRASPAEIVDRAVAQLRDTFPGARRAKLQRSRVIKELRATYSAVPGLEAARPGPQTRYPNVFLAGDWTDTGWPATMEGAVRSGYKAAAAVLAAT